MYEKPIDDFLLLFYKQFGKKLKRVIELNSNKSNSKDLTELYETKGKLIESLNYMSLLNKDEKLNKLFNTLALLITSTNNNSMNIALNFCEKMTTH